MAVASGSGSGRAMPSNALDSFNHLVGRTGVESFKRLGTTRSNPLGLNATSPTFSENHFNEPGLQCSNLEPLESKGSTGLVKLFSSCCQQKPARARARHVRGRHWPSPLSRTASRCPRPPAWDLPASGSCQSLARELRAPRIGEEGIQEANPGAFGVRG